MNAFRNNLLVLFSALILSGCYKNEPIPTANFSFSGNNNFEIPCNVKFTNQSTQAFSFDWYFGNDSTSTDTNPSYTYVTPGKYLVELRAYTESRNEWASRRKEITIKDTVN